MGAESQGILVRKMSLRQRQPRAQDPKFLAYVRRQRCSACGAPPQVHAAHVRMSSPAHDKRETGMSEKPDDRWAVPLCQGCHLDGPQAQHRVGERVFWSRLGLDPFEVALGQRRAFLALFPDARGMVDREPTKRARQSTRVARSPKIWPRKTKWPSRSLKSANRWPKRKFI